MQIITTREFRANQKKYPIQYDLKSIGCYVLLAAVLYVAAECVPIENLSLIHIWA